MEKRALGKGLSALIPDKLEEARGESIAYIKTSLIKDNSMQPRVSYDQEKLEDLKISIQEQGVLQPILVREQGEFYEVVAGERRLKAARMLSLEEVPAIVKNVTDQEALIIALIENIQREELNAMEEAEAYQKLIEDFNYTHESVAKSVGKNRTTITNFLRLLKLPEEIKRSVASGEITVGHARTLLSLESAAERDRFFKKILKNDLSVRELENQISAKKGGAQRREKRDIFKDPQIITLEEGLQKLLGTKVRIDAKKKRGKIVIEFYSPDDLQRIVKAIIKT